MLSETEIKKIEDFIDQGYNDYQIHKKTGHHQATIAKIREKHTKAKSNHLLTKDTPSIIDGTQSIIVYFEKLIHAGEIRGEDKKKVENILEKLRGMMQVEVIEKIELERTRVIQVKDKQWNQVIQKDYVHKDDVKQREKTIEEQDATIAFYENDVARLNKIIEEDQKRILEHANKEQDNNNQIQTLQNRINYLSNKIQSQTNYIENRLDNEIRQLQEELQREWENRSAESKRFEDYRQKYMIDFNNLDTQIHDRETAVEQREQDVTKREEQIRKREDDLNSNRSKMDEELSECMTVLKDRKKNVCNQENAVKNQWEDINKIKEELTKEKKRLLEFQVLLEKTGDFNKFSLPCPSCNKPMLFDATNQVTRNELLKIFGNYSHKTCLRMKNTNEQ